METTVSSLFFKMAEAYGVFAAIFISAAILAMTVFFAMAYKWVWNYIKSLWERKVSPGANLLKHECFLKLDHIVEHRLNNVNVPCVLRKKLYQDIMRERIKCISDAFKEFVKQDVLSMSQTEMYLGIEAVFDDSNNKARSKLLESGVPEFILVAMNDRIMQSWKFQKKHIKQYCYNNYLYKDNGYRMCAVLDAITVMVEDYMNLLESTLGEFNGEIKGLNYNGVVCAKCPVCIHDEYLKECKQELIDEDVLLVEPPPEK